MDKYFYPATPETIHKYAASIFTPIRRGECVSTVWVAMAGRRMWNKFVIENISLFEKELPEYRKYLLVYIEPLDLTEENLAGYLRLLGKSFLEVCRKSGGCDELVGSETAFMVFEDESASYSKLLEALKLCLKRAVDGGMEVVFFLGEFDELGKFANTVFYNNLKSLWEALSPKFHYVFLSVADLSAPYMTEKFGELNAATLENVLYVPIRGDKDFDYLIDFFAQRLGYAFTDEERTLIKKLCGGHPYFVKAATRIVANLNGEKPRDIKDLEEALLNHYEMLSVARRVFGLATTAEREVFNKIVTGARVEPSEELQKLISLGLVVKKGDGGHALFGKLFAKVAGEQAEKGGITARPVNGLSVNERGEIVDSGGSPIDERFTQQEYNVIKFLLGEKGKLKSREEIGDILWGKESYEKYSDWAIDQVMSKVRKKLKILGSKTQLVTIRGRGYKLSL